LTGFYFYVILPHHLFALLKRGWEKVEMEILKKFFFKKKRVAILIDGENLYNALVNLGKVGIDMKLLINRLLENDEELIREPVFFTSVKSTDTEKKVNFFEYLIGQGIKIVYKPLPVGQNPKSEIDPEIAVNICRLATQKDVNVIVLISGDHHFVPAVKFAKEKEKKIKVVCTKELLSSELEKISDEWKDLEELVKDIPQKSKIEAKREEALQKLKEGRKIALHNLEEMP